MFFFFFNDTATTEIYTLSLHDALPISLKEAMDAQGIRQHSPREPARLDRMGECLLLNLKGGEAIEADSVLFATGREPNVHGLGLDKAGVCCTEEGAVQVDRKSVV